MRSVCRDHPIDWHMTFVNKLEDRLCIVVIVPLLVIDPQ